MLTKILILLNRTIMQSVMIRVQCELIYGLTHIYTINRCSQASTSRQSLCIATYSYTCDLIALGQRTAGGYS
jgi:hypothetical protein